MTTRSARLLDAAAGRLEESARVRFIREASDGTLDEAALAAYLAIEERFVRTAARVAGFALWEQPDWSIARAHAATVTELVGPQLGYFADVRDRHPGDAARSERAIVASSVLSDHVLGTAREHGYAGAIVSMFAAESLYAGWCADAHAAGRSTGDLAEWIRLHTIPDFTGQVDFLASIVDALPAAVSDATLLAVFTATLDAEDRFHDSIYEETA